MHKHRINMYIYRIFFNFILLDLTFPTEEKKAWKSKASEDQMKIF